MDPSSSHGSSHGMNGSNSNGHGNGHSADSEVLPPQNDRPLFQRTISDDSNYSYPPREPISAKAASTVVAVLGGWLFGYNCAIIGGLTNTIVKFKFFPPDPTTPSQEHEHAALFEGVLVASILVGGFFGSMLGSVAAKTLGRVRALMIATSLGAGGAALLAYLSSSYWLLVTTRAVLGLGVGWCMTVCPLYVHEVAPVDMRSRTGTLVGVTLVGSISLAMLVNYLFNPDDTVISDTSWRIQFALGAIPLTILFIFTFFIPESATWYAMHHVSAPVVAANQAAAEAEQQAAVAAALQRPLLADESGQSSQPTATTTAAPAVKNPHRIQGWRVLFRGRQGWRNFFTCLALSASNQLTGINPVIFYLPKILEDAHTSNKSLIIATAVGGWNLVSALVPLFTLERLGRRRFFVGMLITMAVGQLLVALTNILANADVTFFKSNRAALSLPAVLLFIGAYQAGPSSLYWVMAPSSFPPRLRDTALSLANALNWAFNASTVFVFPMMDKNIGIGYTFLVFCGMTIISTIGIYMLVPEKEIVEEIMVVMDDQLVSNLPPGWDGERLRRQSSANHTSDPSVYGSESAGSQSVGGRNGYYPANNGGDASAGGYSNASGRSSRPSGSVSSSRYGSRRGGHGREHEDELASLNSGPSTGHGSTISSAVMSRAQSVPEEQAPIHSP